MSSSSPASPPPPAEPPEDSDQRPSPTCVHKRQTPRDPASRPPPSPSSRPSTPPSPPPSPPPKHAPKQESSFDNGCVMRCSAGLRRRIDALTRSARAAPARCLRWFNSPVGRNVLKCTIAYTLASLATFYHPLSALLGNLSGKHVVSTITVYFHPARSTGSMIEAALIAVVAIAFAETVSVLSMMSSVFFGSTLGMVTLSHVLIVVLFIGATFGFMGWVKQKMGNPLVNVGVTLATLAITAVITKESAVHDGFYSNQKLVQVSKILAMGVSCTTAVNLLVWRVSAHSLLLASMTKASTSLGVMLATVTNSYLDGGLRDGAASAEFASSMSAYSAAYPPMMRYLRETKFEQYFLGFHEVYHFQRSAVKAIETLAQSVGGLRSAAETQLYILAETDPPVPARVNHFSSAASIAESETPSTITSPHLDFRGDPPLESSRPQTSSGRAISTPTALFDLFVTSLRPAMESLTRQLSQILSEPPFGSGSGEMTINDEFRVQLEDALSVYNNARSLALQRLFTILEQSRSSPTRTQARLEEVAAACGHFSFSLQSFGEEMRKYLDVLDDLRYVTERRSRSWRWLLWWRTDDAYIRKLSTLPFQTSPEAEPLIKPIRKRAYPRGIPDSMIAQRDTYNWQAAPNASRELAILSQTILRVARRVTKDDILFGVKVGIGASLMAMFAFIWETRDIYKQYRGEWGLVSFMIVCSMTVGASNTNGWLRFLGTILGACFSVVNWTLSRGNPVALVFLGALAALVSFYIFHALNKEALGRTAMLAYNVSTLYAYSLSQGVVDVVSSDREGGKHPLILNIIRHRVTAVAAGIVWGLVVCRLIWPISARRKFKEGVSMLYLQMGLAWRRGPLALLVRNDCSGSFLRSGEQAAMQRYATRLESLRQAAASEFELRGPFPFDVYGRILRSTGRILDGFYAMSLMSQRRGTLTRGETALLEYTAAERAALCDRICHVFQVLASSIMLEYPLTEAVPSIDYPWDRLVSKIFQFHNDSRKPDAVGNAGAKRQQQGEGYGSLDVGHGYGCSYEYGAHGHSDQVADERDYALLYAYALVAGQIADELKVTEREIETLFGVWNQLGSALLQ